MKTLHVSVVERGLPIERRFTSFPISLGRHPSNHLPLDGARVSRVHCQLDVEGDEIVVHDRGAVNGTIVLDGTVSRKLRGASHRRAREVEFLVEGFHIRATLSETRVPELTPEFLGVAWDITNRLLAAAERRPTSGGAVAHFDYARRLIEEIGETHAALRTALNGHEAEGERGDVANGIDSWLSALVTTVRGLQNSVDVLRRQGLPANETSQFRDTTERMAMPHAQGETTLSDEIRRETDAAPAQGKVCEC